MKVKNKYKSPISTKGQITIPQELRNRLGVGAGDYIEFVVEGDHTFIRPSHEDDNPFAKYRAIVGPFPGGEAGIKAWIDDMRNDEE